MKRSIIVLLAGLLLAGAGCTNQPTAISNQQLAINNPRMQLTSSAFSHQNTIPSLYTCDGKDVSPPLTWNGAPASTRSFALIVDDPDAPAGTWVHWTVWNIAAPIGGVSENSSPAGAVQGMTDFGKPGWGGPCPPSGTHHYHFKLYALDTMLNLTTSATKKDLEAAMQGHILDQAELIGLYSRNR